MLGRPNDVPSKSTNCSGFKNVLWEKKEESRTVRSIGEVANHIINAANHDDMKSKYLLLYNAEIQELFHKKELQKFSAAIDKALSLDACKID